MKNEDLCFMSAVTMREKIESQEITSSELTEIIIERIEKVNPLINAICTPTFDIARKQAKKADDMVKKGKKIPPLNGIPTTVKDLMPVKGIRTTFGSKIYENYMPDETEVAVQRLFDAGIVMLGKTNTPEFGYGGITDNLIFGPTRNPWDLDRTSGGSSGGAGSGVASGISPLAIGSDGGGSIRHPATLCGIFGLKPQFGRVPMYPKIGIMGKTLSKNGPMTRYVEDAAMMLDVMKGPHHMDRNTIPDDGIQYLSEIDDRPDKLKIGLSINLGYAKIIDEEVEKTVRDAAAKFEELGWTVEELKLKIRNPEAGFLVLWTANYNHDLKTKVKKMKDQVSPNLVKLIEAGSSTSAFDYLRATKERKRLYEKIAPILHEYDLLITPTVATTAFKIGQLFPPEINGKKMSPTGWMPFTFPFNLTGHPAASIPAGFSKEGLPIGMQLVGKRFGELGVLQAAKAFQDIQPWQNKIPPLK